MNKQAKKAFTALKRIGAPVLDPSLGWGGHFAISGEVYGCDDGFYQGSKNYAADGMEWAEYYSTDYQESYSVFGVHNSIRAILEKNGLYSEWINGGVLGVYSL